jgi:xanthine dehydrogenase accessory factor
MSELGQILDLWKSASSSGDEVCLATIVGIEGSAYRRPGARMLLTSSGKRAGTISGGCLEAEVVKKAWWLTAEGASIQRYSSFFDDDGEMPYGLGCGGIVVVCLERGEPAVRCLEALRRSVEERTPSVIVTGYGAVSPGTKLILNHAGESVYGRDGSPEPMRRADEVLHKRQFLADEGLFVEYLAPPPALVVYGAGDDAQPLVEFAAALGWHVTVADGRSNLARRERFPAAARVAVLTGEILMPEPEAAAVLMTHSYEQDRQILTALLRRPPGYLGMLGPRKRTERLMGEVAPALGLSAAECLARVHSPVGLDIGGHSPATIALSITSEIQAVIAGREPRQMLQPLPVHA